MKKTLIILVLVCCLSNSYAQKTLTFKDTFIVIRKVNNDTTIHQQFTFKNNGKLPLSIKSWKPLNNDIECKFSKGKIKPNDSGFVYFIFSIQKYPITFSKKIELTFSNGKKQQLEIIYCADNDYVIGEGTLNYGETTYDFGKIVEGSKARHKFIFRNISKDILIISHCYHPGRSNIFQYSKEPIYPNQYFEIDLQLYTDSYEGNMAKSGSVFFSNYHKNNSLEQNYKPLHIGFTAIIIPQNEEEKVKKPIKIDN